MVMIMAGVAIGNWSSKQNSVVYVLGGPLLATFLLLIMMAGAPVSAGCQNCNQL